MWHEVPITVNGYAYPVRYTDGAHDEVFLPLLEALGRTHAAGEGRTIAFLAGAEAPLVAAMTELAAGEELCRVGETSFSEF